MPHETSHLDPATPNVAPTGWIVFGDSHIGAIACARDLGWIDRPCEFVMVGGATAVGLRNPNSITNALEVFSGHLLPVKQHAIPVMHLGEVDCGFVIWWRAKYLAESVEAQLEASISAHVGFVENILTAGYPQVVMTGATLPTIRDDQDWGEVANKRREVAVSQRERTELTLMYNERLKAAAERLGCPFVDIGPMIIDPGTGLVDERFRSDDPTDHHLHRERGARLWADALNALSGSLSREGSRRRAQPDGA